MKKLLLVAFALVLAMPVFSFAGSTGSRWDVTFGGYVKFDYGYADKGVNADLMTAIPEKQYRIARNGQLYAGDFSLASKYGALYGAGYETRLNMLIKGPDAWGAKTSAFIEADFRGGNGTPTGTFMLRHAFMKWNWDKTELLLGHTWSAFGGSLGTMILTLGSQENHIMRSNRQPQIRLTQWFGKNKNWKAAFAVAGPSNFLGQTSDGSGLNSGFWGAGMNDVTRTNWPHFQGDIEWSTAGCGTGGMWSTAANRQWPLTIGLGGYFGKDRKTYALTPSKYTPPVYSTDYVKSWLVALRAIVPIIPSRANTKAGSLTVLGQAFVGQNARFYIPMVTQDIYDQALPGNDLNFRYVTATSYGGWAGITYFITDRVFTNVIYGMVANNFSKRIGLPSPYGEPSFHSRIEQHQNWIVNVMYNVNDAIRLGVEYTRTRTDYAGRAFTVLTEGPYAGDTTFRDKTGTMNTIRVGAWYFF